MCVTFFYKAVPSAGRVLRDMLQPAFVFRESYVGADLLCSLLKNISDFAFGFAHHNGYAALDYAGFLCGYGREGFAEKLGVVVGYVCDHTHFRRDYVGRIEASAHSHFNHGIVYILFCKPVESHHHC